MKKSLAVAVLFLLLSQLSSTSISAIEMIIDTKGTVSVYTDGVLGDTTESKEEVKKVPQERITENQEKMIRVRNSGGSDDVEVINKRETKKAEPKKIEAERLRVQLPSHPERKKATESGEKREMVRETLPEKVETRLTERGLRLEEKVELRRATVASVSSLELKSRNGRAVIPEQVEVVIDPETKEIGLVLPNGNIKALNHLPDQAQARIDEFVENSENLELTTLDDGRVVYKTVVSKPYKLFGMFNRKVATKVTLDDGTGEITEEKQPASGFTGLLDNFSF
jgi:hypothetical protein